MTILNTLRKEVTLIMAAEKRVMEGILFLLACFLMLSAACSAQETNSVATPVNPDSIEAPSQQHGRFMASSNAPEVARIIGVDSDIFSLLVPDSELLVVFSSSARLTSDAGNAINFAAGGISTAFSLHGFRQVHGGRRPGWVLPNMLAAFFGRPEEQHSYYPEDVWSYLSNVPLGEGTQASRKQQLLDSWREAHRLDVLNSPQSKQRIALLTSTNAADKKLTIDVLNQRSAMLADVADEVVQMKEDLAEILRGLRR
jgi:hypothetical protein